MKLGKIGADIIFEAHFIASAVGATGLTVTANIWGPAGTISTANAAAAVSATEQNGLYRYTLPGASVTVAGLYRAMFKTAGAATQQHILDYALVVDFLAMDSDLDTVVSDVSNIKSNARQVGDRKFTVYTPVGDALSDTLGAGVLSPTTQLRGVTGVLLQTTVQNVWFTMNGTTPSSTVGFTLVAGEPPVLIPITKGTQLKFLRAANGAILQRQYVKVD